MKLTTRGTPPAIRTGFTIDPELNKAVDDLCQKTNLNRSAIIRLALRGLIAAPDKFLPAGIVWKRNDTSNPSSSS